MSTAVFDVARSIPTRIGELNRLISLAEMLKDKDQSSFDTLCRACCILLASHLEGFVKDLSKTLILDLNFNLQSFSKMPEAMKRAFCEKIAFYQGVELNEVNTRIKQLTAFFSVQNIKIDLDAFTYKENKNKNPGPDVIDSAFSKLGVPGMLSSLSGNRFENIFKNDKGLSFELRRDLKRHQKNLYRFPYKKLPSKYIFEHKSKNKSQNGEETIWHTFIEEVMTRRHSIAHGDTLANNATSPQLVSDIMKMDVLMHGMLYSATAYLCKDIATKPT